MKNKQYWCIRNRISNRLIKLPDDLGNGLAIFSYVEQAVKYIKKYKDGNFEKYIILPFSAKVPKNKVV